MHPRLATVVTTPSSSSSSSLLDGESQFLLLPSPIATSFFFLSCRSNTVPVAPLRSLFTLLFFLTEGNNLLRPCSSRPHRANYPILPTNTCPLTARRRERQHDTMADGRKLMSLVPPAPPPLPFSPDITGRGRHPTSPPSHPPPPKRHCPAAGLVNTGGLAGHSQRIPHGAGGRAAVRLPDAPVLHHGGAVRPGRHGRLLHRGVGDAAAVRARRAAHPQLRRRHHGAARQRRARGAGQGRAEAVCSLHRLSSAYFFFFFSRHYAASV